MTKFKVGDKVKRFAKVEHFVKFLHKDSGVVTRVLDSGAIAVAGSEDLWDAKYFVIDEEEWTIYNNKKPLCELTDEQAAELFNHNRHGGALQVKSEPVGWLNIKSPQWHSDCAYRAKQKSERELFIDSALASCDAIKLLKGDNVTLLEAMFNAGFKAPEDKQC